MAASAIILDSFFALLIPITMFIHLFNSPFTKVEESFNMQAVHDIVVYQLPFTNAQLAKYDHVDYPGAVPRTFMGAWAIAIVNAIVDELVTQDGFTNQLVARATIGLFNCVSLILVYLAIRRVFSRSAANWFAVFQSTQFHIMYYASRTLPNMFAFGLTNGALAAVILSRPGVLNTPRRKDLAWRALATITFAGVLFRSELACLVIPYGLWMFVTQELPLERIIGSGFVGVVGGLTASVVVDTFMWRARSSVSSYRPVWPEWEGFYFNSVLGMSSNWGVSPFYQYGLDLVKLLLNPIHLVLIPFALRKPALRPRLLAFVIPQQFFVVMMSQLPHKEWRFIVYVVPALTAVSAVGASWISNRWSKGLFYKLFTLTIIVSVIVSGIVSFAALNLSSLNYPGGEAMVRFFDATANDQRPLNIWLDNLSCQTGVTRYLENRRNLTRVEGGKLERHYNFDKSDNETERMFPEWWQQFDYAIVEHNERAIGNWPVVDVVNALDGINLVRPGDKFMDPTLSEPEKALMEQASASDGSQWLVDSWNGLGTTGRAFTRGWWINIRMRPRLKILRNEARISQPA